MEWNSYFKTFGVTWNGSVSTSVSLFNAGSLVEIIKKIDHLHGDKMTTFDSQQHITCNAKHFCVRDMYRHR